MLLVCMYNSLDPLIPDNPSTLYWCVAEVGSDMEGFPSVFMFVERELRVKPLFCSTLCLPLPLF